MRIVQSGPALLKNLGMRQYAAVVAVIAVALFFTDFSAYKYSSDLLPFAAPKYDLLILGVLCLPVIWYLVRRGRIRFGDKFLLFILVAALVISSGLVVHPGGTSPSLLTAQLTGVAFLAICYFVFWDDKSSLFARRAVLVFVVLGILVNLFEVLYPGVFSESLGRSAGLYVNPNSSAIALSAGMVLTIGLLPPRFRLILVIAVGAAVFSTLSRSGMIVWVVISFVLLFQGTLRIEWRRAYVLQNLALGLGFALFFFYAYTTVPASYYAVEAKFGSAVKLAIGAPSTARSVGSAVSNPDDPSRVNVEKRNADNAAPPAPAAAARKEEMGERAEAREKVAATDAERAEKISQIADPRERAAAEERFRRAIERRKERQEEARRAQDMQRAGLIGNAVSVYRQDPVLGVGLTRAWEQAPHNAYLLYALAYGFVGWALVPALALAVWLSGDKRVTLPIALLLLLAGLFSHNLLVDRTTLLPLALAAATKLGDLYPPLK